MGPVPRHIVATASPPIMTIESLRTTFSAAFPQTPEYIFADAFKKRFQGPSEDLYDYLHALMVLAAQCSSLPDHEQVRLAIDNAYGQSRQTIICVHTSTPFQSLQSLISKARDIEGWNRKPFSPLVEAAARPATTVNNRVI